MNREVLENPEAGAESPVTYREVDSYMKEIGREVSPLLRGAVSTIEDPDSRTIVDYFFEPRYDQPKARPLLARLSFETVADLMKSAESGLEGSPALDPSVTRNLLVAIRIMDGASILHDDILDHNPTRDGKPSVVEKYGYERALIAGEITRELAYIIFSQAIEDQEQVYDELVRQSGGTAKVAEGGRSFVVSQPDSEVAIRRSVDIQRRVTDLFNDIWYKGCVGQLLDMEGFGKEKTPTAEEYERRLYLLTGQFFEKVMLLGAYAAGIDDEGDGREFLEALGNYGKYYGIASQLRNDLLDFAPEGSFRGGTAADRQFDYQDFTEGRQTMPIILAHEKCSPEEWEFIYQKIGQKDLSNEDKQKINEILVNRGIIKDCERRIFELSKMAIGELDRIPIHSRKKEMLRVWALALNNMVKKSFAGEEVDQDLRLDSLEDLERFFSQEA